jgi:hypothetical protein
MWTSSGLRVWIVWAIKFGKDDYVYGCSGHKNLSTQMEEGESCLPAEDGHRGVPYRAGRPAWADRPAWLRAPPWLGFLLEWSPSLCDLCARVLHLLHRPNALVHCFACIIGPSTWCFLLWVMSMLPCSTCFACHHEFPAMLAAHPFLSFSCGLDESCLKGIQWCIMVYAWLT